MGRPIPDSPPLATGDPRPPPPLPRLACPPAPLPGPRDPGRTAGRRHRVRRGAGAVTGLRARPRLRAATRGRAFGPLQPIVRRDLARTCRGVLPRPGPEAPG